MAAEAATPEKIAFFLAHTSGVICAPLTAERADELELPLMVTANTESQRTAFTVVGRRRHGHHDRDLGRRPGGHHRRPDRPRHPPGRPATGPATSSRCATGPAACSSGPATPRPPSTWPGRPGCSPAGVLCEIVTEDKARMARLPELEALRRAARAAPHLHRRPHPLPAPQRRSWSAGSSEARIPTEFGDFTGYVYESVLDGEQHLALVHGRRRGRAERARPGPLRVPDRRRLRLAALRLRAPAARGHRPRSREEGTRRPRLPARPRGPRHRPGPQAPGLPAPGAGPRHRRRQPRARACRSTAASTASAPRSSSTSA